MTFIRRRPGRMLQPLSYWETRVELDRPSFKFGFIN